MSLVGQGREDGVSHVISWLFFQVRQRSCKCKQGEGVRGSNGMIWLRVFANVVPDSS